MNRLMIFSWMGLLAAAFLMAVPGAAQDTLPDENEDGVSVQAQRVVIELDDDGHVLIDGRRLSDEEGPIVLHVTPVNGQVEVEAVAPHRRAARLARSISPRHKIAGPPGTFPGEDHEGPMMGRLLEEFDFDVPDVAPFVERFHFMFDEPLRESWNEHREVAEMEREARDLARQIRRAEVGERPALEAELRDRLDAIFDRKLELREDTVQRLRERSDEERANLDRRREAREDIIDRRMRSLLGEDDFLDW